MRNYGRFTTSIWRDPDFTRLTTRQQAVYFMLATQPEVSAAGTLPLTLRRWANLAADLTPDELRKVIGELEECSGAHIIVDDDTEELLIRKFVKFDGGIGNEKRRPVIHEAAHAVASSRIRHFLAREIRHVGYPDMASSLWADTACDAHTDALSEGGEDAASGTPSDAESRFDRVVVTKGDQRPQPVFPTLEGEGSQSACPIPPDDSVAAPPPMYCRKHPQGTDEKCGPCGTARKRYAEYVQAKLESEVNAKRRAAEARAACDLCDDLGMRLDPTTGRPLFRCNHNEADSTAGVS